MNEVDIILDIAETLGYHCEVEPFYHFAKKNIRIWYSPSYEKKWVRSDDIRLLPNFTARKELKHFYTLEEALNDLS